jgi:hypothetical protein
LIELAYAPRRAALSRSARRRRKRLEHSRVAEDRVDASTPIPLGLVLQMRFLAWLVPVAFCTGAWIALAHGLGEQSLAHDSKTWPTTIGAVVSSDVGVTSGRFSTSFEPHVTYTYTVDGRSYVGHIIRAGGFSFGLRESAEFILAQYPRGGVSVRYDPDDPSRAVLEPGGGGGWWLFAGAGVASGIVGALLLIRTARDEWLRLTYVSAERKRSSAVRDFL